MENLLEIIPSKFFAFGRIYPAHHSYYQMYQIPESFLAQVPEGGSKVSIFSHGGCKNYKGLGSWAAILLFNQSKTVLEIAGYSEISTSNRMELISVLQAVRIITPPQTIDIYSDSLYVVDGINKWLVEWGKMGWRTSDKEPIKNCDLWLKIDLRLMNLNYKVELLQFPNGNWFNERVHTISRSICHNKYPLDLPMGFNITDTPLMFDNIPIDLPIMKII